MIVGIAEFAFFHQPQESVHHVACQLGAGNLPDDGNHLFKVHAVAVGTVGVHGIEAVCHGDDLRHARDFVAFQMVGVTFAVRPFMVRLRADGQLRHDEISFNAS